MTTQEIIEVIKGLSVLELNDLVKACEEEFGVSAAAGVVVAAAGAEGGAEEKRRIRRRINRSWWRNRRVKSYERSIRQL